MNRARIVVAGLALILVTGLACWFFFSRTQPASGSARRTLGAQPGVRSPERSVEPHHVRSIHANALESPEDNRQFIEIRSELEQRANAGDGSAARRLGMTFAYCNHYQPISSKQLEDGVVEMEASGMSIIQDGHKIAPYALLQKLKVGRAQADRICKNATGIHEARTDASKLAYTWIEKGAALGDPDAQALYASVAFTSYDARTALANAEEVRERKQQAIDYLQQSLDTGDALALLELFRSYASGMLFPTNDETAYAYLYAYSLTSRASEMDPSFLNYLLTTAATSLNEPVLQQAREEGRRLAMRCAPAQGSQ